MRIFLFLLLSAFVAGCGSSTPPTNGLDMGGPDANQIAALVEDTNDAKGDSKKTLAKLAKGTKLADPKKFAQHEFYVSGKPTVNGTEGKCKIRVDSAKGGTAGEVEWEFVKEGDQWKIKSAPLP
jgi:hypothetical protein